MNGAYRRKPNVAGEKVFSGNAHPVSSIATVQIENVCIPTCLESNFMKKDGLSTGVKAKNI